MGNASFNKNDFISMITSDVEDPLKIFGFDKNNKKIKIIKINDSFLSDELNLTQYI